MQMFSKHYKIGEVAKITGMSISRLRYYDKIGMLSPRWRDNNSEYRLYDAYQLEEAYLIEEYQYFGFSLDQIRRLLGDNRTHFLDLEDISTERLRQIDQEMALLDKLRRKLTIMRGHVQEQQAEYEADDYIIGPMRAHSYVLSDDYIDVTSPSHYEAAISRRIQMHTADRKLPWYLSDEFYRVELHDNGKNGLTGRFCIRMDTDEPLDSPLHLTRVEAPYSVRYLGNISAQAVRSHVEIMLALAEKQGYAPCGQYFYLGELVMGRVDKMEKAIRQIVIPLQR